MIKVLIVDDDKLVRKGLISVMPWEQYGMKVVAEAANGEKALELLETIEIDLLMTDISMPVMSGIELMRITSARFPNLPVVVLTLYQDFDYIQEALRLGAIDYIAKVEFEKEQFADILERIAKRLQSRRAVPQADANSPAEPDRHGYAVVFLGRSSDAEWVEEMRTRLGVAAEEASPGICLFLLPAKNDRLYRELADSIGILEPARLIELNDLNGWSRRDIKRWMAEYAERELFYEYEPGQPPLAVCPNPGDQVAPEPPEQALEPLKELWLSGKWVYQDSVFHQLVRDLKGRRLPPSRLFGLLYAFATEWNQRYRQSVFEDIELDLAAPTWYRIERQFVEVRERLCREATKTSYSPEIIQCVLKAERLMNAELASPMTVVKMAQQMNMSRSYFSECFKQIIGSGFNEHLRKLRMDKAKHFLISTNRTIQWIAANSGYHDEKYFSRIFRDYTGMLPSEYRERMRS